MKTFYLTESPCSVQYHVYQALETPILSRCTILDILQQQQRKFFLRQRHIFTQRAEADVEDEIDHSFLLERLFALWKMYISFSFMFEELSKLCILFR